MDDSPWLRPPIFRFARSESTFFPADAAGVAPLHDAAARGNVAEIIHLLELQPQECAIEKAHAGILPLLFAARAGSLDGVAALLERSADVNASAITSSSAWSVTSTANWCAIHAAAQRGDSELLGLLLEHSCDVGARPDLLA